ncbi:Wadjet anti-phage system protein JetD domain-containing protein [Phosphitispora sp. TUW77]|uniref:Wadjet anti-phage system protein JetD domain-containing protein n=1 Tax=Phosphitispora sp. TUW77 TaxID=3152361 RepID=UPI003AB77CE8
MWQVEYFKKAVLKSLEKEINRSDNKYILLENLLSAVEGVNSDMPAFLQSSEGQTVFNEAVLDLVSGQIISPVGKPKTVRGLHLKYKMNKKRAEKDNDLIKQIINNITPPAALDHYIKNPGDYVNDCEIIAAICAFLKDGNKDMVTLNERAYQLFGDEKFFKGAPKIRSRGETVLKRLGLSYADLACAETVEPFFSFQNREFHSLSSRNIFIIENKDTFWSFKGHIMDAPSDIKVDMLVYGEGKKIISSFKFIDEYGVTPVTDSFFYFGDLDAEGINIYCELAEKFSQYKINPFYEGYQAVLHIGQRKAPKETPKNQVVRKENIDRFIKGFESVWAVKLKRHLEDGFYIPQEALSATEMRERFGRITND